ncbi:MAG: flagellin [Pseudomonadota bacterium]
MTSSILTNTSAMIALQTLRATNSSLAEVNNQISTGKKISEAKDGAAIFAISKVMESDVEGFKSISDSLSLGSSTVAVASNATNQVGELLNEIKGKIVAANESNVDRVTLQNEIDELSGQILGITDAAQFNGLNLLKNNGESVDILASLDRSNSGTVSASNITVNGLNFTTDAGTFGSGGEINRTSLSSATAGVVAEATSTITFADGNFLDAAAESTSITIGDNNIVLTQAGDFGGNATDDQVRDEFITRINDLGIAGLSVAAGDSGGGTAATLVLTYTGNEALNITGNAAGTLGAAGIAAAPTVSDATLAAASGQTTTAATESILFVGGTAGVTTAQDVTLTFGDQSITLNPGTAVTTNAELETEIVAAYAAAVAAGDGIDGITIAADATNDGIVISNNTTEELAFSLSYGTGTTAPTQTVQSSTTLGAASENAIDYSVSAGEVNEGDSFRVTIDGTNYDYVAGANATINDVATGLQSVIAADGPSDVSVTLTLSEDTSSQAATLSISSDQGRTITGTDNRGGSGTGDLYGLSRIDVRSAEGAAAALSNIESLIQTNINAQADLGASERRIDIQEDFMSSLIDSFKSGIGSLVDADLEEASARLQALQAQQQLGIQALSIANQQPQNLLALFR